MPIVVPRFYEGPPDVVNGGYACALVAEAVGGLAEVSLRRPVPVEAELTRTVNGDEVRLEGPDGEHLAEGTAVHTLDLEVPPPVAPADAERAMARYPALENGAMFPCFVCGPARDDGLGVFPGEVEGRDVVASVWRPDPFLTEGDAVDPRIVSSVLDCTGTWGAMIRHDVGTAALLARMTAEQVAPVRPSELYVAVGWGDERERRKLPAGSALYTADGELVARARLLCIVPRDQS